LVSHGQPRERSCKYHIQEAGVLSPVYAVYDEGLKEDGAVVGFAGEFVDHASVW